MDTLGRVKIHCWKKLPCFSSTFSFELKRKPISLPLLFVSPPPCSLSMSPKVDKEQSDSAIISTALPESDSMLVHVRFVLQKECMFGERFYLVGDDPLLGLWDPSNGIPLDWSDDHIWSARLILEKGWSGGEQEVPIGKKVEFKFALLCLSGELHWQPGPNRVLLLDRLTTSMNPQASTITVWEDWESAGNQTISLEDEVAVSAGASVVQGEIQVPGPDCNGGTSDQSNKTGDNPELVQGDVDSVIISRTGQEGGESDSESNSGGMILVPGLNPAKAVTQEDDLIDPLETGDRNHSSVKEITIDDCEDRSYKGKDGANLNNISSEEVTLEPTTAGILRNDLQWGQRALEDEVAVSAGASVMQDEIQVPGPDCNGGTSDQSNKTGDNPELVQGVVDSGIISRTGQEGSDSESNSGGMILVPGLNPANAVTQEDDLIDPPETGDRNHSSVKEITIDDCEDRSYKGEDGASLKNISFEEVTLEPTSAGILRNDLQWGQRVLQDFLSSLGFDLN